MTLHPNIVVARALAADAQTLLPLFEAYRAFYKKPADREGALRFLQARLAREEAVVFLARSPSAALGFTLLYPLFSSTRLGSLWLLNDLYVREEARRTGIGGALLAEARSFAKSTGAIGVTLSTALENMTAQKLYEESGYSRDTKFRRYDLTL